MKEPTIARKLARQIIAAVDAPVLNGKQLSKEIAYPKGDFRLPLSDEELAERFRSLSSGVLSPIKQERAIACALNFSGENVSGLIDACSPGSLIAG